MHILRKSTHIQPIFKTQHLDLGSSAGCLKN